MTQTPHYITLADRDGKPIRIAAEMQTDGTYLVQFGDTSIGASASGGYESAAAMVVGTGYTAGKALMIVCTVAGNVKVQLANGDQVTVPVNVGLNILPFSATKVVSSGTTATATYYNLA